MSDDEEGNQPKKGKQEPFQINFIDSPPEKRIRTISLFGDLDEEKVENISSGLLYLKDTCCEEVPEDPFEPDGPKIIVNRPIDFCISTWGGDALGMFAIYDLMRMIREECVINTFAIGKVMSAGVLVLAAGTKGNRRIGKNARVMMHAVRGGHYGTIYSLENEMKETRWLQEQHISALIAETKMTKRQLKGMLDKKVDYYLSAEEALKLGIADIIV